MKKFLAVILVMVFSVSLCISASGASAFLEIKTTPTTEFVDAGGEKAGGWVEGFGIGDTEPGDYVVFRNANFTKAAGKVEIKFAFLFTDYSQPPCTMEIYVGSVTGSPAATINITEDCGHWTEDAAMWFGANTTIAAGKHDIFVKWKNNTGSLYAIRFTEGSGSTTSSKSTSSKATSTASVASSASSKATSSKGASNAASSNVSKTDSAVSGASDAASNTDSQQASGTDSVAAGTDSDIAASVDVGSTIESDESSVAAVASNKDKGKDKKDDGEFPWLIVGIVAAVLVIGGVVTAIVISKKKAGANKAD